MTAQEQSIRLSCSFSSRKWGPEGLSCPTSFLGPVVTLCVVTGGAHGSAVTMRSFAQCGGVSSVFTVKKSQWDSIRVMEFSGTKGLVPG